jgi:hypothetical protein
MRFIKIVNMILAGATYKSLPNAVLPSPLELDGTDDGYFFAGSIDGIEVVDITLTGYDYDSDCEVDENNEPVGSFYSYPTMWYCHIVAKNAEYEAVEKTPGKALAAALTLLRDGKVFDLRTITKWHQYSVSC